MARAGHTVEIDRQRDLSGEQIAELCAATCAMRDGEVERGFSMALGRLGDPRDPELVIARGRNAAGELVAVLVFAPWGERGLSLDVMRRKSDADNGVVEFMVVEIADRAEELGIERLSLNFATFRSTFERGSRIGAGPVLRLWRQVLLFASRWWQIEVALPLRTRGPPGLGDRFVCYRRATELPRIGIAALEVEALLVAARGPLPAAEVRRVALVTSGQANTCRTRVRVLARRLLVRVLGVDPGLTRCGLGVVEGAAGRPLHAGRGRRGPHAVRTRTSAHRLVAHRGGRRGGGSTSTSPTRLPSSGSSASTTCAR